MTDSPRSPHHVHVGLAPPRQQLARALSLCMAAGLVVMAQACASTGATPRPFPRPDVPGGSPASARAAGIVATALALRGVPYRPGGADPRGFDCSGFVSYVFARHGHALPRPCPNNIASASASAAGPSRQATWCSSASPAEDPPTSASRFPPTSSSTPQARPASCASNRWPPATGLPVSSRPGDYPDQKHVARRTWHPSTPHVSTSLASRRTSPVAREHVARRPPHVSTQHVAP